MKIITIISFCLSITNFTINICTWDNTKKTPEIVTIIQVTEKQVQDLNLRMNKMQAYMRNSDDNK